MTTNLTTVGTVPTMTSLEIAELVEARHDSVKRTIERLAKSGAIQLPPLVEVKNHLGQTVEVYRVGKRDSYVVVAQLSPEFTARLVDRWQELEAAATDPARVLNDPAALRGLLLDNVNKVIALQAQVEDMAGDCAALDLIAKSEGLFGFRQSAQILQQPERKFALWLQEIRWCFRQNGSKILMAYADKRPRFMLHKLETYDRPDGTEGSREVLKFTPLGIAVLAKRLGVTPVFEKEDA